MSTHTIHAGLAEAMSRSSYPLQALVYSVALHRFLRWRQPGYRFDEHFGGVLYLYLRGMCGAENSGGRRAALRRLRVEAEPRRWSRRSPTSFGGREAGS